MGSKKGAKNHEKIDVFFEKTQLNQWFEIFLVYRDPVMPAILEERGPVKSR
nr:MAG TPA: hypothetical protein [Caudoviricetes sp.]